MTRRRFIADEFSSDHAALTGDHADHLIRVLRARVGQEFDIAAGGHVRLGRIVSIHHQRVEFQLGEELPAAPPLQLTLLLAIFKFDRMEWAIEKCTELGVGKIVPIMAQRTDSHLLAASVKRVERWQRIAREAAEQSRRPFPPEVASPMKLKDAIAGFTGTRILLAESEDETSLKQALQNHPEAAPITLAIGPEGGWSAEEISLFKNSGWISATLGQTILRAETAAIAATAIVVSGLGR